MDNRGRLILLVILIVTLLGFYLGRFVNIETDLTGYSLATQEDLDAYEKAQEAFTGTGNAASVVILENRNQWTGYEDYRLLDSLTQAWEQLEGVGEIFSITNVPYPRQMVTVVSRAPFLDLTDETSFLKRFKDWEAYPDVTRKFISQDLRYALFFFLSSDAGEQVSQQVIDRLTRGSFPQKVKLWLLQNDLIEEEVKELTRSDSIQLALVSTVLILLTFYLLTKSLKGLLYILTMIAFNLACTLMFMLLAGIPFTVHIITVPCIVIVLSFTDIMHILYHQRKLMEDTADFAQFRRALIKAVQMPMLMTSLTNIIGFLIFLIISENRYLFNFALVSIVGITIAFLSSRFLFIYSLSASKPVLRSTGFSGLNRFHQGIVHQLAGRRKPVTLFLTTVTVGLALLITFNFRIDSSEGEALSNQSTLTHAGNILNEHFFGDKQAEVVVRFEDHVWSDEHLRLIRSLEEEIEAIFTPIYIESPALVASRYRRFQRNGHPKALKLPAKVTSSVIDDLSRYSDSFGGVGILSEDQKTAKISFGYRNSSLQESRDQYQRLEGILDTIPRADLSLELTGRSYLGDRGTYNFTVKIIIGLLLGILAASLLTLFFLKSLRKSLLLVFVNLLPVSLVLAVMLLTGMAITPLTLFFLSLLAGICVDDSIYIVAQGQKYGIHIFPIVVTSAVLTAGFLALGFSAFDWIRPFSWIFLLGLSMALVMDLIILPVFLKRTEK